jgi:hypothetical protein
MTEKAEMSAAPVNPFASVLISPLFSLSGIGMFFVILNPVINLDIKINYTFYSVEKIEKPSVNMHAKTTGMLPDNTN